ncbi:hypothetical protein HJFPF1_12934 [Paramyrothecium foliicola]|nr:hypothetical protein HJFPF1_12934 [Paramyrothecium foliicola]
MLLSSVIHSWLYRVTTVLEKGDRWLVNAQLMITHLGVKRLAKLYRLTADPSVCESSSNKLEENRVPTERSNLAVF